jgi:tungstate transport system substrate-binding protein
VRLICMIISVVAPLLFAPAALGDSSGILRIGMSTSLDNSGFLEFLLPKFLDRYPYDIRLSIVGSGKALRMARTGKVDMVWTHSPGDEEKFVASGQGVKRRVVMRNDFILVGPGMDPAGVASTSNAHEALKKIADGGFMFASRGDDSGTNKKERLLWKAINTDPYGEDWYLETGGGMETTLKIAQENRAYTLIDRATFVVRNTGDYEILLQDPDGLSNPYSVIATNPASHKNINFIAASRLIDWLTSQEGQGYIADFRHNGEQLYQPLLLTSKSDS